MDLLILGLATTLEWPLRAWFKESLAAALTLDIAGALVGPLLGLATVGLAWWYAWRARLRLGWTIPFFIAVSPPLVHGTVLGRPDHQALLIFLFTAVLIGELEWWRGADSESGLPPRNRLAAVLGLLWAGALWVSLYEPVILAIVFTGTALTRCGRDRRLRRERWICGLATLGGYGLCVLLDGWRIGGFEPEVARYFRRFAESVMELKSIPLTEPLNWPLWGWLGIGWLPWLGCWVWVPDILRKRVAVDLRMLPLLVGFTVLIGLVAWQLRWGYFTGIAYAFSLPWVLSLISRHWIAAVVFVLTLFPMAMEWDRTLYPPEKEQQVRALEQLRRSQLRRLAEGMRGAEVRPFLASWWRSPSIAYWSGQPGVCGSSHQGLNGIIAGAEFFMADDPQTAREVLRKRKVATVIVGDADVVVEVGMRLLRTLSPEWPMARLLMERPRSAPRWLKQVADVATVTLTPPDSVRAHVPQIRSVQAEIGETVLFRRFEVVDLDDPQPAEGGESPKSSRQK
jgi:hypothetical protein